jgi:catechol 2,3-dioxygenase-like lactoylglutathione lyase family enzyme
MRSRYEQVARVAKGQRRRARQHTRSTHRPVPRERRGTRSIVRTCLRVRGHDTLKWWVQRFDEHGVPHGDVFERDGRLTLRFEDPAGQRLALVDDGGAGDPPTTWDRSPVPNEHQIRGLGPIVISIPTLNPTDALLTRVFNMRLARDCPHPDNPGTRVHVFEWEAEVRTPSCTLPYSRICLSPARAPAAFIMSPSHAGRQLRRMGGTTQRVWHSE